MSESSSKKDSISRVLENVPLDADSSASYFTSRLAYETDASDVYADLRNGIAGIIVVDARTPQAYARGHIPGAVNLPYRKIDSSITNRIPKDTIVVTYCDGVFCNASTKAAARFSSLGFRVKEMLDGLEGWKKEGFPVEESVLSLSTTTT
jgi:rhodanese-related sulfurtransferase